MKNGRKTIPSNDESSSFKTNPGACPESDCFNLFDDDDEAHALSASTFQNLKGTQCRLDMLIISYYHAHKFIRSFVFLQQIHCFQDSNGELPTTSPEETCQWCIKKSSVCHVYFKTLTAAWGA